MLKQWFLAGVAMALGGADELLAAGSRPPNLIVIVADDMGYSDAGCFGGEISTPALDRLASEGVRLTCFRNGGMCVVTRASLLTGQWWPRALPAFRNTPLLSERLQSVGYRTALVGKWHLPGHPMDRGFDHFYGFLGGFSDHFAGGKDYRLDRQPFTDFGTNYYSSDAFTDRAIRFIKSSSKADADAPFFLYLSYQAPHNPLQAPREDILKYRGKYLGGWQVAREARFRRQRALGIMPRAARLPDYPRNLPDWSSLSAEQRDLEDLRMAVFAAMIERMDQGIGRLVEALKKSGKAEDTLILFLSDNGTDPFSVVDRAMLKRGLLPGDPRSNYQPGTGWAYVSVTPWRLYKISQHAGGVTTGAIAWWPKGIPNPGRIEAAPLHVVDVMPTLLALAESGHFGAPIGQAAVKATGCSFLPLFKGRPWQRNGPLFFQYMDNRAIRTDRWTLAEVDGAGWELFDTISDPLETENLALENSAIVSRLNGQWLDWWRAESGEPAYKPKTTRGNAHYKPQGDRGSGSRYNPSSIPSRLAGRYPLPNRTNEDGKSTSAREGRTIDAWE